MDERERVREAERRAAADAAAAAAATRAEEIRVAELERSLADARAA